MRKWTRLGLISLERRDVPAQFGIPWADHQITMSFAPDGTSVDGAVSNLYQTFGGTGTGWKTNILHAAQTWAAHANLTIGVVGDNGAAAGANGLPQHDPRFGDIRVFGRALAPEIVAITVPPGPAAGTRAGDIIINTAQPLNLGGGDGQYDLYSCMLQETGHALGIGNSADINSPMYDWYQGVRTGITPADAERVAALYGSRNADAFDLAADNGLFAQASSISAETGDATLVKADGDVSSLTDNDFYKFVIPQNSNGTITVQLRTSGESLLQGRLSIYAANQDLVWQCSATSALAGDLMAVITNFVPGATYVARVDSAPGAGDFGVGRYQINVDFNPVGPATSPASSDTGVNDAHTNDSVANATTLTANAAHVYGVTAKFADAADVDVYKIAVPSNVGAAPLLTITIRSTTSGLSPLLSVVDASSVSVPTQVLRNSDGWVSVQANVTSGHDVYLVSAADPNGAAIVGAYRLDADLNTSATPLTNFVTATLNAAHPVYATLLTVHRGSVMHFALNESAENANNSFGAQVEVTDTDGNMVVKFGAASYKSASADRFLAPGVYKVRVGIKVRTAGAPVPNVSVSLRGFNLSDPIGVRGGASDSAGDYDNVEEFGDYNPFSMDGDIIF